ncbi:UvrD-helicase domain-containing protein [Candidatus Bathyarchaeota archaeon]|nr:UvrD-helicase domain-containing protein [Candidatus Bathyarchaeota archaeon]
MELIDNIIDILFFGGRKKYSKEVNKKRVEILQAYSDLSDLTNNDDYFTKKSFDEWLKKWKHLSNLTKSHFKHRGKIKVDLVQELNLLYNGIHNPEFLEKRNNEYIEQELFRYKEYFDSIETFPLTERQREAIIIDEHRNLVIAGAGTGKTSTLIGKIGYMLKKGNIKPEEILLLSFGRDPKNEMVERLQERFGLTLDVNTFHGLGMKIIAEAHDEKPSVTKLSTDNIRLQKFIGEIIKSKQQEKNFIQSLNRFFLAQTEYKSLWEFKTLGEYHSHLREKNIRSLKGDLVKSYEELEIANYLYINGIIYEYEQKYEFPTASKLYGQYTPDFYLPDYDIYIEHFGIDRSGNTAPCVPRERYLKELEWKRDTHLNYGTRLIETYSYERMEGNLLDNLNGKLETEGVEFKPIQDEQLLSQLNQLGYVQPITGLIATFLTLYKSSKTDFESLRQKAGNTKNPERSRAFLTIFGSIYGEYEDHLSKNKEIDFNDMVNKATEYLRTGVFKTKYKYILVDEFQDISQSRSRLLVALLDQDPECKLFCVGDDWQSIYRFAGSDLNIMTHFEEYYGISETMFLDETFRFNDQICAFSTKFILKNPRQISKQLKTRTHVDRPAVSVHQTNKPTEEISNVLYELNKLGGSVFIIGRYRNRLATSFDYPNLSIKVLTAHKSKGTQADYVIINGLESGKMGFPCEIQDDTVLDLVLSKQEVYPHSEERRLFYVAVTRAKKHVYLIADEFNPSVFIKEITSENYNVNFDTKEQQNIGKCPRCQGDILLRSGKYGDFYSCSYYPYCTYRPPRCPQCNSGYMFNQGTEYVCIKCGYKAKPCPECNEGVQVLRRGQYGEFYGCSNYPECTHTRDISS